MAQGGTLRSSWCWPGHRAALPNRRNRLEWVRPQGGERVYLRIVARGEAVGVAGWPTRWAGSRGAGRQFAHALSSASLEKRDNVAPRLLCLAFLTKDVEVPLPLDFYTPKKEGQMQVESVVGHRPRASPNQIKYEGLYVSMSKPVFILTHRSGYK